MTMAQIRIPFIRVILQIAALLFYLLETGAPIVQNWADADVHYFEISECVTSTTCCGRAMKNDYAAR